MKKPSGIIWFDCDGVLTDHRSSWTYLHDYFGSRDNSFFAELYRKGLISYLDWMKIDIALMIHSRGKLITRSEIEEALSKIEVRPGADRVVRQLRSLGFMVGVISSGVDVLVKRVCSLVNADICLYNELLFVDDLLIPGGVDRVPLKNKAQIIREYSKDLGVPVERTVYVGDSVWDIDVFREVGLSVAIKPCSEACRYADYVVDSLEDIPVIVRRHFNL